jgi:hypothetical protein
MMFLRIYPGIGYNSLPCSLVLCCRRRPRSLSSKPHAKGVTLSGACRMQTERRCRVTPAVEHCTLHHDGTCIRDIQLTFNESF